MIPVVIDEVIQLLSPIVLAWVKYLIASGKDPKAELDILMKSSDAVADAAEQAKFGP